MSDIILVIHVIPFIPAAILLPCASWKAALVVAFLVVEAAVALLALLDHLVPAEGATLFL